MLRRFLCSLSAVCLVAFAMAPGTVACTNLIATPIPPANSLDTPYDIRETHTLATVLAEVERSENPEGILVILDLDETILCWDSMILSPEGFKQFGEFMTEMRKQGVSEEDLALWGSLIFLNSPPSLIESEAPEIIASIQELGARVMLHTKRPSGPYGYIPHLAEWIIGVLQDFDINFDFHADLEDDLELPIYSATSAALAGYSPIFTHGHLFSALQPKGPVLADLLLLLDDIPDRVLFVDDRAFNVTSVAGSMNDMGIECTAYRYSGGEQVEHEYDSRVVELQLAELYETGTWLSEEAARDIVASEKREPSPVPTDSTDINIDALPL